MTRRAERSSTTARSSQPSVVQTYVMAPAQTRLGAATANFRLSVFGTTGYAYAKLPGYSDQLGLGLKGCVTPRTARGPSRCCVDNPDFGDQPSILSRAEMLRPSHLGKVARGGRRQQSSRHTAHMRTNGSAPHAEGLAKYAATTFLKNPALASSHSRVKRVSSSS